MNEREAAAFIASAVGVSAGMWIDVGAGTGTFTRALRSLLGPERRIYAVDSDPAALAALREIGDDVVPVLADFAKPFTLPAPGAPPFDGMLLANALHFVPDAGHVLQRLVKRFAPARVVIVEYDRRAASRWVPFPIASARWPDLASEAGLANARVTARRKSRYAGELYAGVADGSGPVEA